MTAFDPRKLRDELAKREADGGWKIIDARETESTIQCLVCKNERVVPRGAALDILGCVACGRPARRRGAPAEVARELLQRIANVREHTEETLQLLRDPELRAALQAEGLLEQADSLGSKLQAFADTLPERKNGHGGT